MDFDFTARRAERERMRAERRDTLRRHLDSGITILETWPGGRMTDWVIEDPHDPKTRTVYVMHHESGDRHAQFVAGSYGGAQLAEHLENRSNGFGLSLSIYCWKCGENTIPIDAVVDDAVCVPCGVKHAEQLAEQFDSFGAEI